MKIYNVSQPIVTHYINLVRAGKRSIEDVPEDFRQEVADILGISMEKLTLDKVISMKIQELSLECQKTIFNGTDVELSNGIKHYSFTENDQTNIKNWYDMATKTRENRIPYHADNEECEFFSCQDIISLYLSEQKFILYHNTYFNMMKSMIKSLSTIEEVENITYGSELSEEYREKMAIIIEQSEQIFDSVSDYIVTN